VKKLCKWDDCFQYAERRGFCKLHYNAYVRLLKQRKIDHFESDIKCLNENLDKEILGVNGQWNHGNNK
jgi:hypothetical protein